MNQKGRVIMTKIEVGIVGFGVMGQLYADALKDNPWADVKAVTDIRKERLDFAKKTYGCEVYEEYQAMYDAGTLDCVLVTLPDFQHRDPVVKAAEAGLHIMVEKPFATNMDDADAMVKAVEKSGVKCMVEFFNRWSPPFTYAKKAVESGELGEVISFFVELNDTIWVPTEMLQWSARSSPGWFLMSHSFDLASWITGKKPEAVYAVGVKKVLAKKGIDTYDLIEALVEYPDGALGRFTNCWVLPQGMPIIYELKMRIVGSKTAIDIDTSDQEIHLITRERLTHPITDWGNILGQWVGHPYTMLASFIDSILKNMDPLVGYMDGWNNTKFLDAVHRSVVSRKTVSLHW
jgi:predicted dehydrogenase